MATRLLVAWMAFGAIRGVAPASADPLVLDRQRVVELARAQAPEVKLAEARLGEARAARIGARAPVAPNPEVGIAAGPRDKDNRTLVDVIGTVVIPIDVSGAPSARSSVGEERARAAAAGADNQRRLAVGNALAAFITALGAEERLRLAAERAQLDEGLHASTEVKRRAGTIGDLDVQLAVVLRADSRSRKRRAEGERDVALVRLRAALGLPADSALALAGSLDAPAAPPLEALLVRLPGRPDRLQARAETLVADADARLQRRLGIPAPRIAASGGRDGELFARFSLDVPIPIYQRNQTARAVAAAHRATAAAEGSMLDVSSEADLRAAYASYAAALASYEALHEAAPSMTDVEHLATRAYELGQSTLPTLILARRESAVARLAYLEARIALAQDRTRLDVAVGDLR